jgi:hypothetical protein
VNDWLVGVLGGAAILACPAAMLAGLLGPRLPWRRLAAKARRIDMETRP